MMAVYQYTARDTAGNEFSSIYTNVQSVTALREDLAKLGYLLVRARRERTSVRPPSRIRQPDVAAFAYKFAGMYSAGLPIATCLETLEQQVDNRALQEVIADVRRRVQAGSSLASAFEAHRNLFSDFFLGMIGAGESAGKLSQALELSAQYLEKRLDLRQKTRAAFVYPLVVGIVCAIVVTCLLIFVVPTFSKLVGLSFLLRNQWWLFLIGIGVAVLGTRRLLAHPAVRTRWEWLMVRVPLVGPLNRLILVSQFVRTFGMLISVGVPLMDALEAAGRVAGNQEITQITADLKQAIRAGRPIAGSLRAYNLFPPMVVQLVAAGEGTGILADMLKKGADLLDKEADRLAASLLVKLEPALTVIMGIVIGLILMGVYLPMFDYMATLK
jgi:type IV pilus assembly protein PilC